MDRHNAATKDSCSTSTAHPVDASLEEGTTLRHAVRGMALGASISYLVCVAAMGLVVGWGLALLIAVWPAVFVGLMFGGLGALSGPATTAPLAIVVPLARQHTIAGRAAA